MSADAEFEDRMNLILKEALRTTHNSAINAAARMVLLHQIGGTSVQEIAQAVLSLQIEKEESHEHPRPALISSRNAP
jgi:hypothetical protein